MADRIAIASDHAAIEMKAALAEHLRGLGHEVLDLGPEGAASVDYPDYGYKLAAAIASGAADKGVAICGSGIPPPAPRSSRSRFPPASPANITTPTSSPWARG